jgi:hypothetical protein
MLGFLGLPKVKLKHSFWLYLLALVLAIIPGFMLRSLFESLIMRFAGEGITTYAMYFLGYIISYSVLIVIYEGLKTGKFKLSGQLIWRMFMAWLRTITVVLPAMIIFGIGLVMGIGGVFFISTTIGAIITGVSVLGMLFLIPLSIILQWYWYERGA